MVTVADQGTGIPEENLSRMFDPFFSSSETRETGLVLSIAYGLMHRLGGNISAANRPGGGSVYTLTFPLASPPPRREQRRPAQRRRARILLVDDESDNLEVLEELLELEGHHVDTEMSGKAAVERFHRGERYDLVLCDVGMPQMSGWEVVSEIRRIAPAARIWLLTGWANEISEHDPDSRTCKACWESRSTSSGCARCSATRRGPRRTGATHWRRAAAAAGRQGTFGQVLASP